MDITPGEFETRKRIYERAHHDLTNIHRGKDPTVLEVVLYMTTMMKEEPEKILEVIKEIQKEEGVDVDSIH